MDIYLPIAGQSVNALFIIALGFLVGVLSGMFGVGGGFLTTPLLMFYGISPPIAVASAASQISDCPLFEPFRRRQKQGEYAFSGSGLGLSICRKLVEAMGSQLEVETAPEYGTRFHFTLDLPVAGQTLLG